MPRSGTSPGRPQKSRSSEKPDEIEKRARHGFRLELAQPAAAEGARLVALYHKAVERYRKDPKQAMQLATQPVGPLPKGVDLPGGGVDRRGRRGQRATQS